MSRRCLSCGGKRGSHDPSCDRLAALREARSSNVHPETVAEIVDRSRRRQRIRGKGKPHKRQRNIESIVHTRGRRGWAVKTATGDIAPPLPPPPAANRINPFAHVELIPGTMGSRFKIVRNA